MIICCTFITISNTRKRKIISCFIGKLCTFSGLRKDLYIGDRLIELKMPVRFIWGDKDAFEKPESALPKASAIKDYKFEIIENAGHCPWLDQPEQCSHLIISMLQS